MLPVAGGPLKKKKRIFFSVIRCVKALRFFSISKITHLLGKQWMI